MAAAPVKAALLAALSQEVQPFLRRVRARQLPGEDLPVWEFTTKRGKGVAALTGMGEDAARRAAAWVLERYQPQVVISLGFGGAVTPELPPGAMVLGESFWRYEPEAQALQELAVPPFPVWFEDLVERLQAAGLPVFRGSLVTTRGIIHKANHQIPLQHLAHPVLDLETSATAGAAHVRNLPFLTLRVITDAAAEEIPDFLKSFAQEGKRPTVGAALAWLAANPRSFLLLFRLWRRSHLAALRLAQALEVVLAVS
jgi:adenosylhomocysteine nucleosidase